MRVLLLLIIILSGSLVFGQDNKPKKNTTPPKLELRPNSRVKNINRKSNLHKRQAFVKRGKQYQLKTKNANRAGVKNQAMEQNKRAKQAQIQQQNKKKQQQLFKQKQREALKKKQLKRQQRLLQKRNQKH
jgi:hypothetical protein